MIRDHERRAVQLVRTSAHSPHGLVAAEQVLRGNAPHRQNDPRAHHGDLLLQVVAACGRFVRLRIAVVRRATFEDIGDEHLFAALADREQHLVQQLAGATDEYRVGPALREGTARAGGHAGAQLFPAGRTGFYRAFFGAIRDRKFLNGALVSAVGRVARQPDVDTHRLQVGATLLFGADHGRNFATMGAVPHQSGRCRR